MLTKRAVERRSGKSVVQYNIGFENVGMILCLQIEGVTKEIEKIGVNLDGFDSLDELQKEMRGSLY